MRRNRVLILFAVLFAASIAIFWLGSVLADVAVDVNNELTVNVGISGIIDNSLLLANDPDTTDEIVTYTLVTAPANGMLVLTSTSTTLTPDSQFNQSDIDSNFLVYTHDGTATIADSFNFTVTANATITDGTFLITINQPPEVLDQVFNVNENSTAGTAVDTIVTSDLNTSDTFTYTILDGNLETAFEVGSSNGAITVANVAPLDFETNENITFTVEVEDMGALTDTAVITVNINNINEAPTVDPATFSVPENSSNGTAVGTVTASDPEEDDLTYSIISGDPDNVFSIGATSGQIAVADNTFFDFETQGPTPHFSLTVEVDDDEFTDTATIEINVTDVNEAPTIDPATFSVPENSSNGTPVDTVTASDPEEDDLTFSIISGDPDDVFDIDPDSGQISVADNSFLDFEAQGTTPHFSLTVQASDGALTGTAVIEINVTDVNEAPTVDTATFSVPENIANTTDVGTPVNAIDPEDDPLTFSITAGDPDNVFDIAPDTGQISVADNTFLDFEDQGTTPHFSLTVQASDGALTGTAVIEINVTDVNEAPTVYTATFDVDENSPNGTAVGTPVNAIDPEDDPLTFSITAGDPDNVFDIDPDSGQISVANNSFLDYEAFGDPPHFSLTVQVIENSTTDEFTHTATITIEVTDVNEEPIVNGNSFSINENTSNTTLVGIVTALDPDVDDDGSLTFDILSGDPGGAFSISNDGNNNGFLRVADNTQLDYEVTQSFMLSIIVTDHENLEHTADVSVTINNLFDEAPTVSNATFTVAENSNNGVVVGTVSATDPEFASGDELTFAIVGGNTGTVFAINSSSGQITVPDTSKLDADAMPTFNLTVRATDRGSQIDTGIITINVSPLPITNIYLPMLLNNYPPIEPNNNCSQSYAIGSGADYVFTADDVEDWYVVTLTSSGNLTVILSSFEPAQGQLIVYGGSCGSLTLLGNNGNPNTTDKTLNLGVRPAGTYYIRVFSQPVTNTTYTLRVNVN